EVGLCAEVLPNVGLRCTLFGTYADEKWHDIVIQLSSKLTVKVTQREILMVLSFRRRDISRAVKAIIIQTQAIGQPQMRFSLIRNQLHGLFAGSNSLVVHSLSEIGLRKQIKSGPILGVALHDEVELTYGFIKCSSIQQATCITNASFQVIGVNVNRLLEILIRRVVVV